MILNFNEINKNISYDEILTISNEHAILDEFLRKLTKKTGFAYIFVLDEEGNFYNFKNYLEYNDYKVKIDTKNKIVYYAIKE